MNMFCFYMFQVCLEFSRVVGKSLRQELYEALDHHSPRLMEIFKAKRGLTGQVLADLMRQTKDVDDEEGSYNDVPVGILCHEQENISRLHTCSPFTTMCPQWESSWRETL
ncbi:unnamed protein product [Boreogadus saida]